MKKNGGDQQQVGERGRSAEVDKRVADAGMKKNVAGGG
jgi:hypothetical protein